MKLHLSTPDGLNLFTAYGDDYVAVNQIQYRQNLILSPSLVLPEWTSSSVATLTNDDVETLLGLGAEVVLLGTGKQLRFPAPALLGRFALAGVGFEVMDLQAACRTYNILAAEGRKVAAALLFSPLPHPTPGVS